jgi:hypothetical protein
VAKPLIRGGASPEARRQLNKIIELMVNARGMQISIRNCGLVDHDGAWRLSEAEEKNLKEAAH